MIHESDKFSTVFEDFRKSARDFFQSKYLIYLSYTVYICQLSIEATIRLNVKIYGDYITLHFMKMLCNIPYIKRNKFLLTEYSVYTLHFSRLASQKYKHVERQQIMSSKTSRIDMLYFYEIKK